MQLLVTKLSRCALIGWISVPSYSCNKLLLDLLTGCARLFPLKWWMSQKSETLLKCVYQLLLFNNFLEPYWHVHWRVFWCSLESLLMFIGESFDVHWRVFWCSLESLLMFIGESFDVHWRVFWCSLESLLMFIGESFDVRWRVFWCSLLRYRDGFIESSQSHTSEFHSALPALHKSFKAVLLIGKSWWIQNQSNIQQWKWWWCYGVAPEMCL
jgi:hypothetical protein